MVQKWDNVDFEIISRLTQGEVHLRELSKQIKIPHSTLSRRLVSLRKQFVLDYREEGKNKKYFLKKNIVSEKSVFIAEEYKCLKTVLKYPLLLTLFQDIIEKSKADLIILFGSYAKGIAKEESDIDIYIETNDFQVKEDVQKINHLLSVKIGVFNPNDLLIKEIIKNHVIIKGVEKYYEKIKFFR